MYRNLCIESFRLKCNDIGLSKNNTIDLFISTLNCTFIHTLKFAENFFANLDITVTKNFRGKLCLFRLLNKHTNLM